MPLYQLLGGAAATRCMVYTPRQGLDIAETVEAVASATTSRASRPSAPRSASPACRTIYGTGAIDRRRRTRSTMRCRMRKLVDHEVSALVPEAVRGRARGRGLGCAPPARHASPPDADRGRPARQGSRALPAVLAGGRCAGRASGRFPPHPPAHDARRSPSARCSTRSGTRSMLIEEQLIDYIRVTTVHAGGVTALRRSSISRRSTMSAPACHGAMDMSPIAWAPTSTSISAVPNFGIQEFSGYTDADLEVFPRAWSLTAAICIPARLPATASISTRSLRPNIPISAPICR